MIVIDASAAIELILRTDIGERVVLRVLTEALDAPLLTCDGKLARSHGHRATIELLRERQSDLSG